MQVTKLIWNWFCFENYLIPSWEKIDTLQDPCKIPSKILQDNALFLQVSCKNLARNLLMLQESCKKYIMLARDS